MTIIEPVRQKPLTGIAPWVGGKRLLAREIIRRLAALPHTCYAEPFIGMGGVFLRRPQRAKAEAINDRSGEVSTLFRVVQRHPDALAHELRFGLSARAEVVRLRAVNPETLTDIERAARLLTLQYCGFGGKVRAPTWGCSVTGPAGFIPSRIADLIRRAHQRLAGVHIDSADFEAFIGRWDRPSTLFYLDPPYWGCETYYGAGLWERGDFERLERVLRGLEGRFILSLNDHPEVRRLFAAYQVDSVQTTYHVSATGPRPATELLITGGR